MYGLKFTYIVFILADSFCIYVCTFCVGFPHTDVRIQNRICNYTFSRFTILPFVEYGVEGIFICLSAGNTRLSMMRTFVYFSDYTRARIYTILHIWNLMNNNNYLWCVCRSKACNLHKTNDFTELEICRGWSLLSKEKKYVFFYYTHTFWQMMHAAHS